MCRLFGAISDQEIDVHYWFIDCPRPFSQWATEHCHGWGMGWYDNGEGQLVKEPKPANQSDAFEASAQSIKSKLHLCHLRKASEGAQTLPNCHPFKKNNWLFEHNGSISKSYLQNLIGDQDFQLEGETDSEIYFNLLIQQYQTHGIKGFKEIIDKVKLTEFTALNFILSDGHSLYAYWEASPKGQASVPPSYYQLYYSERVLESPKDKYWRPLETEEENSTINSSHSRAVLICSEKISDDHWKEIPLGQLLIAQPDLPLCFVPFS
jgi:predicted glutamine amidotransferase